MLPAKAALETLRFPELNTPMPSEKTGSGAITELFLQRHYSISEIAELWGLDEKPCADSLLQNQEWLSSQMKRPDPSEAMSPAGFPRVFSDACIGG